MILGASLSNRRPDHASVPLSNGRRMHHSAGAAALLLLQRDQALLLQGDGARVMRLVRVLGQSDGGVRSLVRSRHLSVDG